MPALYVASIDGAAAMSFFFIQMADPQLGMFAASSGLSESKIEEFRRMGLRIRPAPQITGFADETALYEKAIAEVNRLRPDFVVMCGDMVNDQDDQEQLAEVERITAQLDSDIPMYWAAGNHDVGNTPTPESLRLYRQRYGEDDYSFDHKGSHFLVLNSCIFFDPSEIPGEWERQLQFVTQDLQKATADRPEHILVSVHHPLFVGTPDDDDSWLVIPQERRRVLLELFKGHGVTAVFTGHWHQNNLATDGELQMVTTGPVGYPLGDDPSGFRIVKVLGPRIEHEYYGFDDMPQAVEVEVG